MINTKYLVFAILATFAMIGCEKTAEGIQKDSAEFGQKAASTAAKASEGLKEVANNAEAAITLTHAIKTAILANPSLNENGNLIDVDSTKDSVILSGHVRSQAAKDEAEAIARKVLAEKNATQGLVNKLTIEH